jgi:hypothetical protein
MKSDVKTIQGVYVKKKTRFVCPKSVDIEGHGAV